MISGPRAAQLLSPYTRSPACEPSGKQGPPAHPTVLGHEAKVTYRGKPSEGQGKLAFSDIGQGLTLELIQTFGPDTFWKEHLHSMGEGVHHIALKVKDLDRTIETFTKQDMPLIQRGRFDKDKGDYYYMDSKGKLRVTVELLHWDDPAKN